MNKPEILAPAGSFDSLTAAVRCGADAVYLGGRELNARRNAANFSDEELAQAVEYCHARGVKVYITLNTLVRDDEMETAMNAVRCACDIKADALILQDIGLTSLIRKAAPDMPLHASTQTSVQTLDGIKMLADMGFCRAVLPRELSKKEIENSRAVADRARDIRPRRAVHVPFGSVPTQRGARLALGQQGLMRPAVQASVCRRRRHGTRPEP